MKREIEVVKYVLEQIEDLQKENRIIELTFDENDDYSVEKLDYHIALLADAGFIDAKIIRAKGPDDQVNMVRSITFEGHDLLDALRSDKALEMAEKEAEEKGSKLNDLPIEVVKALVITSAKKLFNLE